MSLEVTGDKAWKPERVLLPEKLCLSGEKKIMMIMIIIQKSEASLTTMTFKRQLSGSLCFNGKFSGVLQGHKDSDGVGAAGELLLSLLVGEGSVVIRARQYEASLVTALVSSRGPTSPSGRWFCSQCRSLACSMSGVAAYIPSAIHYC